MVAKSFQVGDLVWAKMKGYPPWPGKIINAPANAKSPKVKKSHHYVSFYFYNNHAWIADENISLHNEKLVEIYGKRKKSGPYASAIEAIVNASKNDAKYQKRMEDPVEENSSEYHLQSSFEKSISKDASIKSKSPHSNSTPKRKKEKYVKKVERKRGYSSDVESSRYQPSPKKKSKLEDVYATLLANIPPNINYENGSRHEDEDNAPEFPISRSSKSRAADRSESPPIDLNQKSDNLKEKKIMATKKKIGFLGLGSLGQGFVKNLIQSEHKVTLWNRTTQKSDYFAIHDNVEVVPTPADVVTQSDIIFCCVSDAKAAKELVFGNWGVLRGLESCSGVNKGYVELTSLDPGTSEDIEREIKIKGGRYLEAPLCGSKDQAVDGTLFILAAGDQSLYEECKSCFDAASKDHMFISGKVGTASKYSIVHNMFLGTVYAALAETVALVERVKLNGSDFLDILRYGGLHSDILISKGHAMLAGQYPNSNRLKHVQRAINLGLGLGGTYEQPMPITAAANEVYKQCRGMNYGDYDVSAVYESTKQ